MHTPTFIHPPDRSPLLHPLPRTHINHCAAAAHPLPTHPHQSTKLKRLHDLVIPSALPSTVHAPPLFPLPARLFGWCAHLKLPPAVRRACVWGGGGRRPDGPADASHEGKGKAIDTCTWMGWEGGVRRARGHSRDWAVAVMIKQQHKRFYGPAVRSDMSSPTQSAARKRVVPRQGQGPAINQKE